MKPEVSMAEDPVVEGLTWRMQDVEYQLRHGMFLSDDARGRLETELLDLVEQRERARHAMKREEPPAPTPKRRISTWPTEY